MNECGTMILDAAGKIRSCGTAASQLFGGNFADMAGKPISAWIAGLEFSPAGRISACAHGSGSTDWQRFCAHDLRGNDFAVEVTIAPMRTADGGEMFLLHLRRPELV